MTFENNETYLLACFLLPLLAVVTNVIIRFPNLRDITTVVISIFLFSNMLDVLEIFRSGDNLKYDFIEMMPGLSISFSIEPLGMIFALIVSFLWIVSTVYSIGYMRGNNEKNQNRFFCFFALSIFAALGVAFSSNLLTLFVFYELMTVCTFPLVTHSGTSEAKKSGRLYIGILMGTSIVFLLPAIILTYVTTGSVDFAKGGILANAGIGVSSLLLFLYVYGIGKAALMPMHKWLPAAMVAPTPVSALLHAVAVVKAGVFSIVKIIVYIFGVENLQRIVDTNWWSGQWLAWVASFTIIVASLVALKQDNLKKMLAYSTVSQLSYVILAVAILAPKSVMAAAFHIAAHAFGKITLFFAAGSIYTTAHKSKISQLSGIGRQMPITMVAFSIGAISMIGIPPAVGFISKWYMISGTFDRELYWIIIVIIISTLLNAAYFLPVIYKAFFEKEKESPGVVIQRRHGESSFPIVLALMITAAATLVLFIYPGVFMELAKELVN